MKARIDGVGGVLIRAENPRVLARFYREALGVPVDEEQDDGFFGELATATGVLRIAIVPRDADGGSLQQGRVALTFHVAGDFDAFVERLEHIGVDVDSEIEDAFGRCAYFRDLEGNQLAVWTDAAAHADGAAD